MVKIKTVSILLLFLLIVSFVFAQDFELEEIDEFEEDEEFIEEEFVEEEILIEDRAGITPDSPFYFIDEVIEDINLAVKKGEDKANYALNIAEEKVAEAKLMADKNKSTETERALTRATNISAIVEQEVSPDLENETNEKMEIIKRILKEMEEQIPDDWDEIKSLIDAQNTQADKNKIAVNLAGKIEDLCEKLALQDWKLMEAEPRCNPDNAPDWLDQYIGGELKVREENAQEGVIDGMTQCFTDPRECDCSEIPVKSHRKMCEKAVPLAIECEFEFNQRACDELDSLDMPDISDKTGKTFTDYIGDREKDMFDKFMPPECEEQGLTSKDECEDLMHEIYGPAPEECMEDGEFIGEDECEEIMEEIYGPTPEECLDENGRFIGEDKCHEIMEELYGPTDPKCLDVNGRFIGDELCIAAIMPECAAAGGTTWEDCEEFFHEGEGVSGEGLPGGCIEDGDYIGKDACDEVIWDETGRPPAECFEEGEFIGGDLCRELTGQDFGGAPPDECVEGTEFVGHEECGEIMGWGEEDSTSPPECLENGRYIGDEECMQKIDPECIKLGASDWEECHNIMKEKYGASPDECFEEDGIGFIGELKCAIIIKEMFGGEGGHGTAPDYCFDEDDEYIGDEECSRRNDERGGSSGGDHGTAPDYCFDEDDNYIGDDECSALNNMRIIEEGVVADYCFDEDYGYIGDEECSALNDQFEEEYIEDLYGEINELEEDLDSEDFEKDNSGEIEKESEEE
jgi:hypothetical protein